MLTLSGHTAQINCCAYSPDGARAVSGCNDGTLKIWDASTGAEMLTLSGHSDKVYVCAYSPDGATVLSGSVDRTLRLWDAAMGGTLLVLRGHSRGLSSCIFSPDGARFVSGSYDATLKIWDARWRPAGDAARGAMAHAGSSALACAVSPDGAEILSGAADSTIKLWDLEEGARPPRLVCGFAPSGIRRPWPLAPLAAPACAHPSLPTPGCRR